MIPGRSCDSCICLARHWGVSLGQTVTFRRGAQEIEARVEAINHIDSRVVLFLAGDDGVTFELPVQSAVLGIAPGLSQDVWGPMEAGA